MRKTGSTTVCGRLLAALSGRTAVPVGGEKKDPNEPADQALGRSRGGFSTNIPVICDGAGRPLNAELSPGQTPETPLLEDLWNTTEVTDQEWKHFIPPDALAGDKAYRSAKIIDQWDLEGVQPVIPEKGKKANDVDHPHFDREAARRRNVVERLFGRLQEFRRLFGRVEKTAVNSLGMIHAAGIRRYLAELSG